MKTISILGSTGSIGVQTLDIVRRNPDEFKVIGLACHSNISLLREQILAFKPEIAAVFDEESAEELQGSVDLEIVCGMDGLKRVASLAAVDTVLNALVGSIGIEPTVHAIKNGKNIALANKETLVSAGEIVMDLVRKHKVELKPIDSEHSAIFQCTQGQDFIKKIIITCSGGAFRDKTLQEMKHLTSADALMHPNWDMGNKITIDSATLMNKGFEVIEARMLFNVDYDDIEVVIHPQSIIHSLVEFADTSVLAQLGWPDMRLPIQYALTHPHRYLNSHKPLDLVKIGKLNFLEPDLERFPCLGYAYEAGKLGGTMPAVLNAANEIAVQAFLKDKIGYLDIARLIREQMDNHTIVKQPELDDILSLDRDIKENLTKELRL